MIRLDSRVRDRVRLLACGATALFAISYAAGVVADGANPPTDSLEEVTVTAQRRVENVRDVPISITVFDAAAVDDLQAAVGRADIVSCATLATAPLVYGVWLRPGTHLDLIGGFRPDMREADDEAVRRARVFIDTEAALAEAGDLTQPLAAGVLKHDDIAGSLFTLCRGETEGRRTEDEITLFKAVGSALEDLYVLDAPEPREGRRDQLPLPCEQRDPALPANQVGALQAKAVLIQFAGVDQFLKPPRGISGAPDLEHLAGRHLVAFLTELFVLAENLPAKRAIRLNRNHGRVAVVPLGVERVRDKQGEELDDVRDESL